MPRQPRTLYFNDARHYYLFCFEPPMRLPDAQRPIDEVAGTGEPHLLLRVGWGGVARVGTGL